MIQDHLPSVQSQSYLLQTIDRHPSSNHVAKFSQFYLVLDSVTHVHMWCRRCMTMYDTFKTLTENTKSLRKLWKMGNTKTFWFCFPSCALQMCQLLYCSSKVHPTNAINHLCSSLGPNSIWPRGMVPSDTLCGGTPRKRSTLTITLQSFSLRALLFHQVPGFRVTHGDPENIPT